jgi:N-acetyl-anhydromuramyl-L-alanine amidase AmpD
MASSRLKRMGFMLLTAILAVFMAVPLAHAEDQDVSANSGKSSEQLQTAFEQAAKEFNVPVSVLMSVAYNESRWDQHGGKPSTSGGYGVMHLTQVDHVPTVNAKGEMVEQTVSGDPNRHTLDTAAQLLGVAPDILKEDPVQNIRGGAALLAKYEKETAGVVSENAADWYGAVVKYSGSDVESVAKDFADQVYSTIEQGAKRLTPNGQNVVLAPKNITPNKQTADTIPLRNNKKSDVDCPNGLSCEFIPALYEQFSSSTYNYGNYDLANRPYDGQDIRYIIIHDIEGSYQEGVNTFLGHSYVSAHYVVRSSDGHIAEMVRPKDIAWQAGNWYINAHSIGIEHGGTAVDGAAWYSEQMYRASAKLVKYLAARYDIPIDREHIFGHDNVPGTSAYGETRMHWDPATYWDWAHFFDLLGAPINPNDGKKSSDVVTINPNFHTNTPPLTYGSEELVPQPSNFVYLRTEPSFDAPLFKDPALPNGGTTNIYDWGDKAVTGQSFYKADEQGDWTAIYYGGQKVWFYNPHGENAVPSSGLLIKPRDGLDSIPVYGTAYPNKEAYEKAGVPAAAHYTLQYTIPAGQVYVATGPFQSDYYYAKEFNKPSTYHVIQGDDEYYQISFNHRIAFVKKSDVELVK